MRLRHLNAQLGQRCQQHEDAERARQQDLDVDGFINRKLATMIRRQKAQLVELRRQHGSEPEQFIGYQSERCMQVSVFPAVKATVEISTQVTSGGRRDPQGTRC
ncbi:hypothetical protein CASFOL_011569 [Castilleja foliolosa]|uniref:Uncharacterized protein n=1 Tax=Castilleja foliolosa TaxID=1961234 RepID=A0ABD3E011_9LAMI